MNREVNRFMGGKQQMRNSSYGQARFPVVEVARNTCLPDLSPVAFVGGVIERRTAGTPPPSLGKEHTSIVDIVGICD